MPDTGAGGAVPAAPPDGGWGWLVLLSAHCMHFLVGGLDRATGLFYREILRDLRQSSASTAGFSAMLFSFRYLSGPAAGVLCKYWGCRAVMMSGGILSFLGLLLSSFCRSLGLINLTLGCMTGLGNGLAYTSGLLAVNEYFNRRKATAMGIATAGTGVGSFVLPLLTQLLINVYSFRGCMWILAALSLNLLVCGALLYPLPPQHTAETGVPLSEAPPPARRRFLAELWSRFDLRLFTEPRFALFAFAALCISAGFKPVPVVLVHDAQLKGLGTTAAVMLISISGACDTVSRFSVGLLFDLPALVPRRRRLWTLGMLLTAASCAGFGLAATPTSLALCSAAFGLTTGLFAGQEYSILSDLIGRERTRTGLGLLVLCRGLGVAFGPPLAGAVRDASAGGSYAAAFAALGGCVLVGFASLCALEVVVLAAAARAARRPDTGTVEL